MNQQKELKDRLERIRKAFDLDRILNLRLDRKYVQRYYRVNRIPYSLFHTRSDLIYMGISRDGKFKKGDLLEHARTVENYVKTSTKTVLELATGRGASSFHLAQKYPSVEFRGIDISKGQLEFAFKKAKKAKKGCLQNIPKRISI